MFKKLFGEDMNKDNEASAQPNQSEGSQTPVTPSFDMAGEGVAPASEARNPEPAAPGYPEYKPSDTAAAAAPYGTPHPASPQPAQPVEPKVSTSEPQNFTDYARRREAAGGDAPHTQAAPQKPISQPYTSTPEPAPYKPKKNSPMREKARIAGRSISRPWFVAGSVITSFLLVFAVIGIIATAGWFRERFGDMDTPQEAGNTLVSMISNDDFKGYQRILASDAVKANDKALFESLKESLENTAGDQQLVSNFILIRLENGKQYLCSIYFDEHRKEYAIRSVQEVPIQMQNIFVS